MAEYQLNLGKFEVTCGIILVTHTEPSSSSRPPDPQTLSHNIHMSNLAILLKEQSAKHIYAQPPGHGKLRIAFHASSLESF